MPHLFSTLLCISLLLCGCTVQDRVRIIGEDEDHPFKQMITLAEQFNTAYNTQQAELIYPSLSKSYHARYDVDDLADAMKLIYKQMGPISQAELVDVSGDQIFGSMNNLRVLQKLTFEQGYGALSYSFKTENGQMVIDSWAFEQAPDGQAYPAYKTN